MNTNGTVEKKARNVDRVYGGAAEDTVGRVQRKLMDFGQVRGLVFGAFGEASEGVHELVHHLANSRLKAEGLQQGSASGAGEKAVECCLSEGTGRVPAEQVEAGWRRGGSCQQEEGECCEGRGEMGQGEGGSDGGEETGKEGGEAGHVPPGLGGQGY